MKAINSSQESQTIDIILANGERDSVNLQPRSRASLPHGSKIDPNRLPSYSKFLKTMVENTDPQPPAEVSPQSGTPKPKD